MGPKTKKRWDLAGKKGGKRMQRFVCYLFMFYYYLSISNGIRLQTFFKNSKFSLQNVDLRGRVGRPSLYLSQVWSTRETHGKLKKIGRVLADSRQTKVNCSYFSRLKAN